MGAVYIATDERFGSIVAIKETLLMDDNYRKAIEREARLLNSLKHVALPRVSDHFLEENGQFLVMEYIPGEDLSHMIEASGKPFPVEQVLTWADQLLDALDFLHNQSIPVIHRDIKPQNLKFTASGQIILLDFGLAKGNPTDAGHQTAAKSIFGYSRNYASLEQIQGTGTDPRSDLYSLAATLYHLLTGVPPEDALTRAMSVLSNRPDPLSPANAIAPLIPSGVAGVLRQSLALNADERPSTAGDMRQMLRQHENYVFSADHETIAEKRANTEILAEKTRLMPDVTRREYGGQTDVKTEVLPRYVTEETSVRSPITDADRAEPIRKGSRTLKVASALAALLLVAGSAAGLYFYDPSLFGVEAVAPVVAVPTGKEEAPSDLSNPEPATETETADSNISLPDKSKPTSAPQKAAETGKGTRSGAKDSTKGNNGDVRINGETVYVGNIKIDENGIVPNTYVDKNGVRRPIPPPSGTVPFPGLTEEQFRNLPPEQQRKLRDARRKLMILQQQHPTPPQQ